MQFICMKTEDGRIKGKIAFYCHCLGVTRQGFYWYLKHRDDPWKYNGIAEKMLEIVAEDECNDTYGRIRMYEALTYKYPDEQLPSERTVYRIMQKLELIHRPKRKPNGITKADREARTSDDLLKRDFTADRPYTKCVTDITEIPAKDGKLYVSAIFDCYDLDRQKCLPDVSTDVRCNYPQRPGQPIYQPALPGRTSVPKHHPKHEQRRWTMSRQRSL